MPLEQQNDAGSDVYLQYAVGDKDFASAITDVFLIIKSCGMINVPDSPVSMLGAIYHGGRIVPVVNMRTKLGMSANQEHGDDYSIVVVNLKRDPEQGGSILVGLLVDKVAAIHEVAPSSVTKVNAGNHHIHPQIVKGKIELEGLTMMIPNAEILFGKDELESMMEACENLA